jgi:hypothetical protein
MNMTPTEQAQAAFNAGLDRTANPYAKGTVCWEAWAEEYMRLNDNYMALAVET